MAWIELCTGDLGAGSPERRHGKAGAAGGGRLSKELLFGATAILAYLVADKVLVRLLTADNYGYFRDELYYVAAGKHLQFGYVDFPLFVALAATRAVFGESLSALHLPTVLVAAVVLAGLMARRLGGGGSSRVSPLSPC